MPKLLPRCWRATRRWRNWRAASTTSRAARRTPPGTSTSWTRTGSASTAGRRRRAQVSTVRDNPLDPINLAFDKAGNLMVVSYAGAGTVYTFKPASADPDITVSERAARRAAARHDRRAAGQRLAREPAGARPTLPPVRLARRLDLHSRRTGFRQRRDELGSQDRAPLLRGFGLATAAPGKTAYITSEAEIATWQATVGPGWRPDRVQAVRQPGRRRRGGG